MREAVKRYCDVIESASEDDQDGFIDRVRVSLAELLAAAPGGDSRSFDVDPDFDYALPLEAEAEMIGKLKPVIGERDIYRMIFEPFDEADKPVGGMLSEDLASVWSDLRPGLDLIGGPHEDDALFDWWDGYYSHWGPHAASALYVLVQSAYY